MRNILITALGIYSVLISPSQGSTKYVYLNATVPTDASVQSDNYPKVYPRNSNVTWVFETTRGHWGVYFRDFDLSRHEDFTDGGDMLRIQNERNGSVMTYTYTSATESYISKGPRLFINFLTDNKVDDASVRGFDLQIVYGQTESEVRLKLHEATRRKDRGEENGGPPAILIASIVISALVIATVAILCVLKLRAASRVKSEGERDVFGVRRGSGVRHSRRGSSASPPQTPDGTDGQGHQTPTRQGGPAQTGRLGWMARAERNNSVSSTRRDQSFESSGGATCATSAPHNHHINNYSNHAGVAGPPDPHRPSHNQQPARSDSDQAHEAAHGGTETKEIEQVFECVSDRVGKCRDTSHSFRFTCSKAAEASAGNNPGAAKRAKARTPGLNDREAEETRRKSFLESEGEEMDDSVSSSSPPPYESLLEVFVPASDGVNVVCYGNVLDAQPSPFGIRSEKATSDIYINAVMTAEREERPTNDCERGSGTSNPLDASGAADCQAATKLSIPECVVSDHSSLSYSPATAHRELPAANTDHQLEAAQLCFVDGYAYIVPQPDELGGRLLSTQQAHPCHRDPPCRLSTIPDAVRASQLANELGYIDMFTSGGSGPTAQRDDNIYTNKVARTSLELANIAI